jgi:hypothetical protein
MPRMPRASLSATLLMLATFSAALPAQTLETALQAYLGAAITDAASSEPVTIADWTSAHPGEIVEAPDWSEFAYGFQGQFDGGTGQDGKVSGLWCLRSSVDLDLAEGLHVHRVAYFYQPNVEQSYEALLPPLPAEGGDGLRRNGCRLVRILHEFSGAADANALIESITRRISMKPDDRYLQKDGSNSPGAFWTPVHEFTLWGRNGAYFKLERNDQKSEEPNPPAKVLFWSGSRISGFGEPSGKAIDAKADEPWIPMRAAMVAGEPAGPTLALLSLLPPPTAVDRSERTEIVCDKKLFPSLRWWMNLHANGSDEQRAADLLFADQILGYASDICAEFQMKMEPGFWSRKSVEDADAVEAKTHEMLVKHLGQLGIETGESARPANEYYAGNLMPQVLKLANPKGQVAELARIAKLGNRCSFGGAEGHSAPFIAEGESILAGFRADDFTPVVDLMLAEEYSQEALNAPNESDASASQRDSFVKKAIEHYLAWYDASGNERDRALVWQEIWGLQAGLPPRLVPFACPYE